MSDAPRRILAIETSGRAGSAAVGAWGGGVPELLAGAELPGEMRHAGELMPAIDRLMRAQGWPADSITDVFVSIGPGSFTGLRIGVTVARTLAWSIGARVVAVPTMDVLARNALELDRPPPHLAVLLDAKRSHVFAAAFELREGAYIKTVEVCMIEPHLLLERCPRPVAVLGEVLPRHRSSFEGVDGVEFVDERLWAARARNVFYLGSELMCADGFTMPGDLVPLYIRRPDPVEKWEQKHGPQAS
jgi:tRNA threonylcarbamoyladenosine biosynthesis protein TsaB